MNRLINVPGTEIPAYKYLKNKYGKKLTNKVYKSLDLQKNDISLPMYKTRGNGVATLLVIEMLLSAEVHSINIPIMLDATSDCSNYSSSASYDGGLVDTLVSHLKYVLTTLVDDGVINTARRVLVYSVDKIELKFVHELKMWQEPYILDVKFIKGYQYGRSDVALVRQLLLDGADCKANWLRVDYIDGSIDMLVGTARRARDPEYAFFDFVGKLPICKKVKAFSTSFTKQEEIQAVRKELYGNS